MTTNQKACALPSCKHSFEPLHSDHFFCSEKCMYAARKIYGGSSRYDAATKEMTKDLRAGKFREVVSND